MYDMHYDLLTILYYTFKIDRNSKNLDKFLIDLNKIYNSRNVIGGIVNLYFMTHQEMKEEFGFEDDDIEKVIDVFRISTNLLDNMKVLGFIPQETDFLFGIEGASYIKNLEEVEALYQMGLRSITPVYNFKNRYGSGFKEEGGLTVEGIKLIEKMIELGMIIDVSHANEETFFDIINLVKEKRNEGLEPIVIASHSNVKQLRPHPRNLTDEQIRQLRDVDGYLSLFTNSNFVCLDNMSMTHYQRQQEFLKHIDYIIQNLDFPKDKILLSSDDMNFHPDPSYHNFETFPLATMAEDSRKLLAEKYGNDFAEQLLCDNARKLFEQVKSKQKIIGFK